MHRNPHQPKRAPDGTAPRAARARRSILAATALALALAAPASLGAGPPPAAAPLPLEPAPHNGPPVYLEFGIEPGKVHLRLQGEQQVVHPWLGMPADKLIESVPMPAAEVSAYVEALERFWAASNSLSIDGQALAPKVLSVELAEAFGGGYGAPIFTVHMEWTCQGWPSEVRVLWGRFDGTKTLEGERVPGIFRWDPGNDPDFIFTTLSPEEPEFIWHAAPDRSRKRTVNFVTGETRDPGELPLASVLILAALFLSIPIARRWKPRLPLALGVWVLGLGAAFMLRDQRSTVPWTSRVSMPSEDQAVTIFETLHQNVYRAFSAKSEDAIYELLAKSVAPELLDELYVEVYESLILRSEGGAVCDVQKIDILERKVLFPDPQETAGEGPRSFDVDCKWRVHGLVTHWGHQHERTNEYSARYHIAHDGASWKIAAVDVTEHERVEDFSPVR